MLRLRQFWAVVIGLYGGIALVGFPAKLIGIHSLWLIAPMAVTGALGLAGGVHEARTLTPYTTRDQRHAIIGWSIVAGLILVVVTMALLGID